MNSDWLFLSSLRGRVHHSTFRFFKEYWAYFSAFYFLTRDRSEQEKENVIVATGALKLIWKSNKIEKDQLEFVAFWGDIFDKIKGQDKSDEKIRENANDIKVWLA